jgi:hypothetical protein
MDPRSSFAAFVRWVMRETTFHRLYSARVTSDGGDNHVDLEPDDPSMQGLGLRRVPVRTGIAGATSQVQPDTRCLFAFDNGDPRTPKVVAWEYKKGSAVVSLDGGKASIARLGDLVTAAMGPGPVAVVGTITGKMTIPNPSPPPATVDVPIPAIPPTLFVGTAILSDYPRGQIQRGAPRVKA